MSLTQSQLNSAEFDSFLSEPGQSKYETVHLQAQTLLNQKNGEIENLRNQIEEAEQELANLKTELESRAFNLTNTKKEGESVDEEFNDEDFDDDAYEQLQNSNREELKNVKQQYEDEIKALKIHFARALKDSERWSEQHSETVYIEKKAELDEITHRLETLRSSQMEESFSQTQSKVKNQIDARSKSYQNNSRIDSLNAQLAEIDALSRDEVREVRSKIDECLFSVEMREREHKNEIEKYDREIETNERLFKEQYQTLQKEFETEKGRLNTQLNAISAKIHDLNRALKKLQKHHENQIQIAEQDINKMKSSITAAQERENSTITETKNQTTQLKALQRDYRNSEQELEMLNNEIAAIQNENMQLRHELEKFDRSPIRGRF